MHDYFWLKTFIYKHYKWLQWKKIKCYKSVIKISLCNVIYLALSPHKRPCVFQSSAALASVSYTALQLHHTSFWASKAQEVQVCRSGSVKSCSDRGVRHVPMCVLSGVRMTQSVRLNLCPHLPPASEIWTKAEIFMTAPLRDLLLFRAIC